MGSSLPARPAGYQPKNKPMTRQNIRDPIIPMMGGMVMVWNMSWHTSGPEDGTDGHADKPPMRHTTIASMTELSANVFAGGAEGFTNANFAGAFGHGDEHNVHDTNAANHEGDSTNASNSGADATKDIVDIF